jgi:hypothetical protein
VNFPFKILMGSPILPEGSSSQFFTVQENDLLNVSLGFSIAETNIPWGPAFMAPIAERIRKETGLPVASAWGFGKPDLAGMRYSRKN